jgi:hypothetical protein
MDSKAISERGMELALNVGGKMQALSVSPNRKAVAAGGRDGMFLPCCMCGGLNVL